MNSKKRAALQNRLRMIKAALSIWAELGEKAVNTQSVGDAVGVSRQRVQQVWLTTENLRFAVAHTAIETGNDAVIKRMLASGHPLAPKKKPAEAG